jgi:hypothetical protein
LGVRVSEVRRERLSKPIKHTQETKYYCCVYWMQKSCFPNKENYMSEWTYIMCAVRICKCIFLDEKCLNFKLENCSI